MYDIAIIGAGLGYVGAIEAAKEGLRVALVEREAESIGGACLNSGCVPSKHLLHYAQVQLELRRKPFTVHSDALDLGLLKKERESVLANFRRHIREELADVDLFIGEGVVQKPGVVSVGTEEIAAKNIIFATGSTPFVPRGIAYDKEHIITSDEVFSLARLPESITILGSGAIGLEFASYFAAQGVDTTVISSQNRLIPNALGYASEELEQMMREEGVDFIFNKRAKSATYEQGRVVLDLDGAVHESEKLLVATGRVPNTKAAQCEEIALERGIKTDEWFETTCKNHYAIGDCNGRLMLAHSARAQILNVIDKIKGEPALLDLGIVPSFIYTQPMSYASVGMDEESLKKANVTYKRGTYRLRELSISRFLEARDGVISVLANSQKEIIGAEILAPNAADLISIFATAISLGADVAHLKKIIFPHPTISEGINMAIKELES